MNVTRAEYNRMSLADIRSADSITITEADGRTTVAKRAQMTAPGAAAAAVAREYAHDEVRSRLPALAPAQTVVAPITEDQGDDASEGIKPHQREHIPHAALLDALRGPDERLVAARIAAEEARVERDAAIVAASLGGVKHRVIVAELETITHINYLTRILRAHREGK